MLKPDDQPRKVEERDPNPVIINNTSEKEIIERFNNSVNKLKSQLNKNSCDNQFVFQSCIVLSISALDYYIHEIVKHRILLIFKGCASKTNHYNDLLISMNCVEKAIKKPESIDWLSEGISNAHNRETFQKSKRIERALKIIDNRNIFEIVAKEIKQNRHSTTKELDNIVELRNRISHQDCSQYGNLEKNDVSTKIDFIESTVNHIHNVLIGKK